MDVLADKRCAPTVSTTIAIRLQGANAAAQQEALELLDVMGDRRSHGCPRISPPPARFLLVYRGGTLGKRTLGVRQRHAVDSTGGFLLSELATVAYIDSIVMI
jgi:hypothetical protein